MYSYVQNNSSATKLWENVGLLLVASLFKHTYTYEWSIIHSKSKYKCKLAKYLTNLLKINYMHNMAKFFPNIRIKRPKMPVIYWLYITWYVRIYYLHVNVTCGTHQVKPVTWWWELMICKLRITYNPHITLTFLTSKMMFQLCY